MSARANVKASDLKKQNQGYCYKNVETFQHHHFVFDN